MMCRSLYLSYCACLLGFLFSLYLFYPGYLSPDSLWQLQQAETFTFNNWHPPVMALVWHFLILLFPFVQPSVLMLILQLALLWLALIIFVYVLSFKTKKFLWCIPCMGILPFVLIFNGVLWKDIQMGNTFLLVFVLLLLVPSIKKVSFKYGLLFIILLLSFYAFCLRHEAVFACMPLFYLLILALFSLKRMGRVGVLVLAVVVFFGLRWGMERVIHTQDSYPAQQVMLYDLAGMSIAEHQMLVPLDRCTVSNCFQVMQSRYKLSLVDPIMNGLPFDKVTDEVQYQELKLAWFHAIGQHPFIYLHDRFRFFAWILLAVPMVFPAHYQVPPSVYPVSAPKAVVTHFFHVFQEVNFPFNLFFWILFAGLCFILLRVNREKMSLWDYLVCRYALYSGLLIWLSHFIVASASDFRYYYWTMLSVLFSFVVIVFNVNFSKKGECS